MTPQRIIRLNLMRQSLRAQYAQAKTEEQRQAILKRGLIVRATLANLLKHNTCQLKEPSHV